VRRRTIGVVAAQIAAALCLGTACAPSVPQDLPREAIAINLNTKIAPDVRASVDKELDQLFGDEKDLF